MGGCDRHLCVTLPRSPNLARVWSLLHSLTEALSLQHNTTRQILPVFDKQLQEAGLETLREAGIEVLVNRVGFVSFG